MTVKITCHKVVSLASVLTVVCPWFSTDISESISLLIDISSASRSFSSSDNILSLSISSSLRSLISWQCASVIFSSSNAAYNGIWVHNTSTMSPFLQTPSLPLHTFFSVSLNHPKICCVHYRSNTMIKLKKTIYTSWDQTQAVGVLLLLVDSVDASLQWLISHQVIASIMNGIIYNTSVSFNNNL